MDGTILVADDDRTIRTVLTQALTRAGCKVHATGSLMTLSYFVFSPKQDSVGVLQNLFPTFTALYSLYLDIQHRGWNRDKLATNREVRDGGE